MTGRYEAEFTYTNQQLLDIWRGTLAQIGATGQAYSIGNRSLTRANLREVRETINDLERKVAAESASPSSAGSGETKVYFKRPL